jgi:hypothetical protein
MISKRVEEPRCTSGVSCASYPALGEPSKLSRNNPGPRCFACEERRGASRLKAAVAKEKVVERKLASKPRISKSSNPLEEHVQGGYAYEVLGRRRRTVLTCERGLGSALDSGDELLARKWSRLLRDAEQRLVWAEADLERARKATE